MSHDFLSAINSNLATRVANIIASGTIDINAPMQVTLLERTPALVLAAGKGFGAIVELLLDAGARIDEFNQFGFTACYVAARSGHTDVVRLLVSRGASLAPRGFHRLSPLSVALLTKNEAMSLVLIEAGAPLDDGDTLCRAAAENAVILQALLQKGVDFARVRDNEGKTACHRVALHADTPAAIAALNTLVDVAGVDIDAQDNDSRTCVHLCVEKLHLNQLRWLIERGANVDLVTLSGQSPLHSAFGVGNLSCVLMLLAAGADVHAKDSYGQTACHLAANLVSNSGAPLEVLHALIAAGADFDATDVAGTTPRQTCAAQNRSMPAVREIERARRRIVAQQLEFVRARALQVCIGLQPLDIDALRMCEILRHACGPVAQFVPFHCWWQMATTVKHFRSKSNQ